MTMPTLPAQGSTSWYPWASAIHSHVANGSAVNVKDYGAVGDGTTDDTPAINAAIAVLSSGGVLLFPPGTYRTSSSILIRGYSRLVIDGRGATISCTDTSSAARVLSVESCTGLVVQGLTVQHATTPARQTDADGLAVRRCSDVTVRNVVATNVCSVGIRIAGSIRVSVRDCSVLNNLADGIGVYGAYSTFTGSMTSGSATLAVSGVYLTSADVGAYVQVPGAGAAGAALNAQITAVSSPTAATLSVTAGTTASGASVALGRIAEDVTVSGCHTYNTGDDAISSVGYLSQGPVSTAANHNVSVIGNTIRTSPARGVLFAGQDKGVIADNLIDGCADAGVFATTEPNAGGSYGCTDIEITGNVLVNCGTAYPAANYGAIFVNSGTDSRPVAGVQVHGNTIRGGGSYYIGVGGDSGTNTAASTTDVVVRGNQCIGGNGAGAGINVVKSTNVAVTGNRIDKANQSAVTIASNCAGVLSVQDNNISTYSVGGGGYSAISVPTSALTDRNIINGVVSGSPEYIAPPASLFSAWTTLNAQAWWGVNGALLARFTVARPTAVRYLNFHIGTASGNVQVGIVQLNPANLTSWTALIASSGVIACPAAGAQHYDLGAGITLAPGEYALFFWADNTTVTTAHDLGSAGITASRLVLSGTYSGGITGSGAGSFTNRYPLGLTAESV